MSILRDIFDIAHEISDQGIPYARLKNNSKFSMAKESNTGILQFPVLCSSTLSLEDATMVSKALERQYVSFVQVITSINSIADDRDVEGYLKRIHQNFDQVTTKDLVNESFSFDLPLFSVKEDKSMKDIDRNIKGLLETYLDPEDEEDMEFVDFDDELFFMDESVNNVRLKECVFGFLTDIKKKRPDAKFYKIPDTTGIIIQEGNTVCEAIILKNNKKGQLCSIVTPKMSMSENMDIDLNKVMNVAKLLNESCLKPQTSHFRMDILNERSSSYNYDIIKNGKNISKKHMLTESPVVDDFGAPTDAWDKRYNMTPEKMLTDNDVKKSNELVPTMLHLKTFFRNELGDLQPIDYMIGVKTLLHVIPSDSMIENVARGANRNNGFFNFVKWTTGETDFWQDFVFQINDTKQDIAIKYSQSPWWSALIRRRKYAKVLKLINLRNQLVPNTTIVLSMDEVVKLKNEKSIDLMDTNVVRKIVSEYFLLGFVIVDASVETAYFFFDGQLNYQQYSYTSLERENSNQAKEMKNIMQVLGKM